MLTGYEFNWTPKLIDIDVEKFYEVFGDAVDLDKIEMNCRNRFLKTGVTDELAHPYFQGAFKYDFTGNFYEKSSFVQDSVSSMKEKVVNLISAPHKIICRETRARLGYILDKARNVLYRTEVLNYLSPDKEGNFQWGSPMYRIEPVLWVHDFYYLENVFDGFLEQEDLYSIAERMVLRHEKLDSFELAFIFRFGFGITKFTKFFGYDLEDLQLFNPERCDTLGLVKKARFCSSRNLGTLRWKRKTPALYNFKLCAFKHVPLTAMGHVNLLDRTIFEKIVSMDGYEPFNEGGNFFTLEFSHAGQARYSGQS